MRTDANYYHYIIRSGNWQSKNDLSKPINCMLLSCRFGVRSRFKADDDDGNCIVRCWSALKDMETPLSSGCERDVSVFEKRIKQI
jgi:hypothetical protein